MDHETWLLFHRLWTKAVGTPEYDKDEWLKFERLLLKVEAPARKQTSTE